MKPNLLTRIGQVHSNSHLYMWLIIGIVLSIPSFVSLISSARPVADDYGHITHFSKVGIFDYAQDFYLGIDSHPLSVIISTVINFILSSSGLAPGFTVLVTIQILLFLFLTTFLISHLINFNQKFINILILFAFATLLLVVALNFSGSATQSSYRAYGLIGWVNFFWQHIPLSLLQVSLFLRWKRNPWLHKDPMSLFLVILLATWGPLEGVTTLGLFIFVTFVQFRKVKFSIFKSSNFQFYLSFLILLIALIFTFFSPSSMSRRIQYSSQARIGHWYERFIAYSILSFREIVVYGIFAAIISGLLGFLLGYKELVSTNRSDFWNLITYLIVIVSGINFIETFSYFAPFHHTVFSFVFVVTTFVGGISMGMKTPQISWLPQTFFIFVVIFLIYSLYSPASKKANAYRQSWDASQVLILSECRSEIHIKGISNFLPGSSMNPDWNSWSCKNKNWFQGIEYNTKTMKPINLNPRAKILNVYFNQSLGFILTLIYGKDAGNSDVIKKFNFYSY